MEEKKVCREYSLFEVLSESCRLFKENFWLIIIVTLLFAISIQILLAFFPYATPASGQRIPQFENFNEFRTYILSEGAQTDLEEAMHGIMRSLIGIIGLICDMMVKMAIVFLLKSRLDGISVDLKGMVKKSLSRCLPAIGTSILKTICLIGLFLLFIIPGIVYAVYWLFALYAVVLHDKVWKDALDYSKNTVKGKWWKVCGYTCFFVFLWIIAVVPINLVLGFLPRNLLFNIFSSSVMAVLSAFLTVILSVFFINLDNAKA